jgi:ATP-dependent DNA helicase RecG
VRTFDLDQFRQHLQQIRRPLQYAARQNFARLTVVQGLGSRVCEWLDAACAQGPPPETAAQLTACRRLFLDFDQADPPTMRGAITTALECLDRLIASARAEANGEAIPPSMEEAEVEPPQTSNPSPVSAESSHPLSESIQFIKGVGPNRAQALKRLGVHSIGDALALLPRRYEDRANLKRISHLEPGTQETFQGTILVSGVSRTGRSRRLYEIIVGDGTGTIRCLWFQFREQYMRQRYSPGQQAIVTGDVHRNAYQAHRLEVHHPDLEIIDPDDRDPLHVGRIVPVYPATEGIHQKTLRTILKRVVDEYADGVPECLPAAVRERLQLMSAPQAFKQAHFPSSEVALESLNQWSSPAHRRLIFEEFFLLELGLAFRHRETRAEERGVAYHGTGELAARLRARLPFTLTAAQERVLAEIVADMQRPHPMNRLLQGDVGSGKTIVALLAMLLAIESGHQAAMMVPTEILAEQHALTIQQLVAPLGVQVALLTSASKGVRRRRLLETIGVGEAQLIVGTHALIQEAVGFHALGLVVIDEQHRFGVLQRATLKKKGYQPDVLVMTATPIPRTLAMTVYGDLDVSVIDQLPPGRVPIITRLYYESQRSEAYGLIRRELQQGRQVYVVYPLIEESEKVDLRAATEMAEQLQHEVFPAFRVGLLHGRLKSEEKEGIMRAFSAGEIRVLVSTTVIEVGVDVPNAAVMLVEHAERFGLAQLHQLRGRVGRDSRQAYCLLMAQFPMSEDARQRLDALTASHDGFVIAERDLEIRGPGEFLGTRQSGIPELRVAHLIRDQRVLAEARREAFALVEADPALSLPEHTALRQALEGRWQQKFELMSVG